jgi:type 1 glutamine amidotransferase
MPTIRYTDPVQVLVAVRGHPFDRSGFDAIFQRMAGIAATMVDQPAAARLMNPAGMEGFDALVLYDMPGLDFSIAGSPPRYIEPSAEFKRGFADLLRSGTGIVALHHALAGWPAWPRYAELLGGAFLYRPERLRGRDCLDSGYAHAVDYEVRVVDEHPVTRGLPSRFAMRDELYLCEVFEEEVTPLLRTSAPMTCEHFFSADSAVRGRMNDREGWPHPEGSDLIGWTKHALASPLVYLQPGDSADAYDNPHYGRLVENAIRWVVEAAQRERQ